MQQSWGITLAWLSRCKLLEYRPATFPVTKGDDPSSVPLRPGYSGKKHSLCYIPLVKNGSRRLFIFFLKVVSLVILIDIEQLLVDLHCIFEKASKRACPWGLRASVSSAHFRQSVSVYSNRPVFNLLETHECRLLSCVYVTWILEYHLEISYF